MALGQKAIKVHFPEDEIGSHSKSGQDLSLQIPAFGNSSWEVKLQK